MPIPSSVRTSVFHFGGGSLRLQATFENLEKLKSRVNQSPFDYILTTIDMENLDEMSDMIRTLFFCLQADVEVYTEAQIHDWLFGNFIGFFTEETVTLVQETLSSIIGLDLKAKLAELEAQNKTVEADTAPKK